MSIRHAAVLFMAFLFSVSARADWGIFQTYAFLNAGDGSIGYAGNSNADGAPSFSANAFTFVEGQSTLVLEGGEIKTWKNGGSNVCGGNLFYRVYASSSTPGQFANIGLAYQSELANAGDQKWGTYGEGIDLLSGLAPGDYVLEVFWNFTGGQFGGCADTQYESNNGNNYTLSFTIEAPVPCVNTFTMDYLGVPYDLVEAGGRCWFAENLQATTFNNGTEIPQAITGLSWQYPGANPYRLPPGSSTGWVSEFGWLYNGGAASNGGICPSGWRVPSVAQWQALIDEFGGNEVAGGAFKETGNVTDQNGTWTAPNTGATNESGMTLRGAGLAYPHDFEHGFRSYGLFWTSDYAMTNPTFAVQEKYVIALRYDAPTALVEQYTIPHGFSIRCIQRVSGCKDNTACNYDASVDDNDPTQCTYPELVAYADADGDGAGDSASTTTYCTDVPEGYVLVAGDACPNDQGKTEPGACGCGAADADSDQDGVLDCNEVAGCMDESACNYNAEATDEGACYWLPAAPVEWEGLAVTALQPSVEATGPVGAADVLWVAPSGAQQSGSSATLDEVGEWTVSWASNAGNENPSCNASATITLERMGCTDAVACNYDATATTAGVDCQYATAPCDTCSGATDGTGSVVDGDTNGNGTCDDSEVAGCMDDTACNYDAEATVSDDSCLFATGCDTCGPGGNVIDGDADNDGVCDGDEVAGCTDAAACNYDAAATDGDDSCVFPVGCQVCSGATDGTGTVLSGDADGDGVCDADEVLACTNPEACNYNSDPTVDTDNSLCDFTGDCNGDCEGTATTTSTGCCIGGNTGYDAYNCSPQGMLCDYDVQVGSTSSSPVGGFTFQAGMTGALSRIRMITLGGSGERAEVRNRDTGELLGQGIPDSDAYTGNYLWRSFTFSDLALEEGAWYKVTLTGGYYQWIGQHSTNAYPGGTKYGINASTSGYATFKTIVCDPVLGCMDQAACNYDATANLSATCLFADDPCEVCNVIGGVDNLDEDGDGVCDADEVPGCTDETACNYDLGATDDDGSCILLEACEECVNGAAAFIDVDGDGVCDLDDSCTDLEACNYAHPANEACLYANGPCEICTVLGGVDNFDADGDGICDADEIPGCQDDTACNYNSAATDSDNSCVYATGCATCSGATDGTGTVLPNDADNDGVCDADEVAGCQDDTACNFNASATDSDDSCVYATGCATCSGATDGTGTVLANDADGDGVCDADEIPGCQDDAACNYNASATDSDNSCVFATANCEVCLNGAVVVQDADNDGVCDGDEIAGCQDDTACNYDASATDSDNSCDYATSACEVCLNGTVVVQDADSDGVCDGDEIAGCQDDTACNYEASATDSDNSCVYATSTCEVCLNGAVVVQDADSDGVCDADEIAGCQDDAACNYNAAATDSNGSCVYATGCATCSGATDGTGTVLANDADSDGICDADEVPGCQDDTACNYNAAATDSDNSCLYATGCATCSGATDGTGTLLANDADNDGVCDADEIPGCQDVTACNYNAAATDSDDLCVYATGCATCSGATDGTGTVLANDADGDGVCDGDEVAGCQDNSACNYNASATDSDGSCVYATATCAVCENGAVFVQDADNDGVCDANEVPGCQDNTACNYDPAATDSDTSCIYATGNCEVCQDGAAVVQDADNDGVCDGDEVAGCQDNTACNYEANATDSDNSCIYATGTCEVCEDGQAVVQDADNDGVCDADEIAGCMDATACNYDASATDDQGCNYASVTWYVDADGDGTGFAGSTLVACIQPAGYVLTSGDNCPNDPNKLTPGTCGCGEVDVDADGDGLCDDADGCADPTACNYAAPLATECFTTNSCGNCGPETTVTCGLQGACNYDPTGDCFDSDLCDFDSCAGCMNNNACNYDAAATISAPLTCTFPAFAWVDCAGACENDLDQNGVCDEVEIAGCMDSAAINFNPNATTDNGSCFIELVGCIIPVALNYDENATVQGVPLADYCTFPPATGGVPGPGTANAPGPGCMEPSACNYDPEATSDNGSCEYTSCLGCDQPSACNFDPAVLYNDGSCEWTSCAGCMNPAACDYDDQATVSQPCDFSSCLGCTNVLASNYDATASIDDGSCIFPGCTNPAACNFDPTATSNDGSCTYALAYYACNGDCLNDSDGDGVCDEFEVAGCTNASACNYDATATDDDGSCVVATTWYEDVDGDGFGDSASSQTSCTQPPGYVANASDNCPAHAAKQDPGACGCDTADTDADGDGIADCSDDCTDTTACNYDANPTAACVFVTPGYDCDGVCLDLNTNGVCDLDEGEYAGCQDVAACNYDPVASLPDPASCTYLNFTGIAVDATSQASAADGLVVPSYTGGAGAVSLLESASGALFPASVWGFMPSGRFSFRMQDAGGCLSVETRSVVIPYAGCD